VSGLVGTAYSWAYIEALAQYCVSPVLALKRFNEVL